MKHFFCLGDGNDKKMKRIFVSVVITSALVSGCAIQTPPIAQKEAPSSIETQRSAQKELNAQPPKAPELKRKIALGRVTNETTYGRSLLRDSHDDPLGKQVTDMLSKALTESGAYLVFERPDISRIQSENKLAGAKDELVGVDVLIVGSLTEFGRKTQGESGFVSSSKKQVAFAKVDMRLVDTKTGQVIFATSGAGESSTETASTFGFGSRAGYDGTLNDSAIRQAVSEVVNRLSGEISKRPWSTNILKIDNSTVFISGGVKQGIGVGMVFTVETQGERIKSPQTGALVTLPGKQIAQIKVESTFGDTELDEGALTVVESGSLSGYTPEKLVVRHKGGKQ